jgi:HK97 gp10 family phage protein
MPDGFDVRDLYVLARSYEAAAAVLPAKVQAVVTETLADVVTDAKALSPYATGHNRDSITYDVTYTPVGAYGEAGPESTYGGYLELGTSRAAPRPYMAPAAARNLTKMQARLQGLIP